MSHCLQRLIPIGALAGVLLCALGGPAVAGEDPEVPPVQAAQAAEPEAVQPEAAEAEPAPSLEELLAPPAQPVCSCRDLCRNDAQCELLYGPGSQCVPVGPCQCRECQATS